MTQQKSVHISLSFLIILGLIIAFISSRLLRLLGLLFIIADWIGIIIGIVSIFIIGKFIYRNISESPPPRT